jgi:hypothetical protein
VSQSLDSLLSLLGVRETGALGLLHATIAGMSGVMLALLLAVAGLAAPAAEELFFRGFMQTRLRARLHPWPAIGVTALAFGLMHLDPVHGAFALAVGLYLGWLTELAGSIRPAIAAHAANNLLSLVQTWLLPPQVGTRPDGPARRSPRVGQGVIALAAGTGARARQQRHDRSSSRASSQQVGQARRLRVR